MDTKNFTSFSSSEYKKETQSHWTKTPCGSNYSSDTPLTLAYFEEIEDHRYRTHPWIKKAIESFDLKGKKVLEIGYGLGTDHLGMARRGGLMHGIDLTPASYEVTKKRFDIYGVDSELRVGDAENLPYPNDEFDFVYSFGVIHHSPDTERIIRDIYRVLKPGGKCWVTVYHKKSIFFWWTVFLYDWILRRGYRKETLKERISRIEYPNDNPNLVIKLYKRREFVKKFYLFRNVKADIDHLLQEDIAVFGRLIPRGILRILSKRCGWYIVIEAVK